LRNFVRQDARSGERRERHERAGARPEATDPESVERLAGLQRELLEAVLALSEPIRGTIWARYYDGAMPREIARRDGVPLKTVKARLSRGLSDLRARLDREHGDRSRWMAAFAPLTVAPKASLLLGVMMMDLKLKIAGALVVTAGIAVVLVETSGTEPVGPQSLVESPAPESELTASVESGTTLAAAEEEPDAREAFAKSEAPVAAPVRENAWSGKVLDLALRPVEGLEIYARSGPRDDGRDKPAIATSGSDGSFEIPAREGRIELAARGERWVTVFAASNAWGETRDNHTIFVAPRRALAGRVVDAEKVPIPGAKVQYIVDASLRRDVAAQLDTKMPSDWLVETDEQGRFAIENAPLVKGTVHAEAIGKKPDSVGAPDLPAWDLEIVLQPLEVKHLIVRGRVVDESHRPVEGAHVALGPKTEMSDADGAFAFDVDDIRDGGEFQQDETGTWRPRFTLDSIFAVKRGKLPTRLKLPPLVELREPGAVTEFTLVLDGEPLSIRGRVLEADGSPVPNAIVRLGDETPFGMIYQMIGGEGIGVSTSAESLLRGGAAFTDVRTDAEGRFTLGGLLDREYRVIGFDSKTLRRAKSEPVRAGKNDVEVRLPDRSACVRVAGRVVGLDGTPIAGVNVGLGAVIEDSKAPTYVPQVDTDEKGRFEFGSVVGEGLTFSISHPSTFLVLGWQPPAGAALDDLVIEVARKAHVQVDLGTDTQKADAFAVLDEHGKPVELMVSRGNMMWMPERADIVEGKSEPLACTESGRTIVLYKAGKEVLRQPVRLVPGEITTVRL
jgi:protocatechuate 3,4-dioxygenase beta subunit